MFCGTLGVRGTPVEEHWFRLFQNSFASLRSPKWFCSA